MKRASLSLSISAIVVIVIAFVVLGLGLSLTRTIFKGAEEKLPEAFAVTRLEAEPTASNPITIPETVEIGRGKSRTTSIGFYNKGSGTAFGATFDIVTCLDKTKQVVDKIPTVASTSVDVGASSSAGYSIIITEKQLPADTYICTIGVKCDTTATIETCGDWARDIGGEKYYETKQFFLRVVA